MKTLFFCVFFININYGQIINDEFYKEVSKKADSLILLKSNKSVLRNNIKINYNDSYFLLLEKDYNDCENCKPIIVKSQNDSLVNDYISVKKFTLKSFNLAFDITLNKKVVGKFYISFDKKGRIDYANQYLSYKLDVYVKFLNGDLLNFNKILKIARINNFKDISSFELEDDPRWEGNNLYEEDEKKWKITWTLKEKNISKDGKAFGFKVIKIDAKKGNVLSKYIEFPID